MLLANGERDLLSKMGLDEAALISLIMSGKQLNVGEPAMRLYIAFMMQRIWNQEPLWEVADRFVVPRGWLQSTLQATCSQASSIARFAEVGLNFFSILILYLAIGKFMAIKESSP